MASLKNTIVLGCFILAGFSFQTWMQIEHQEHQFRYEPVEKYVPDSRFDKATGEYEYYDSLVGWQLFRTAAPNHRPPRGHRGQSK